MQPADRAIKIIKREQRHAAPEEREQGEPSLKTDSEIRREILNTITSWIEQQKELKKELQRQSSLFKREACMSPSSQA